MARRCVCEVGHTVAAVERIDRGREAGGLAGEARQYEAAAARAHHLGKIRAGVAGRLVALEDHVDAVRLEAFDPARERDRKSTRLNSSHEWISYAVFCLKKKKTSGQGTPVRREIQMLMATCVHMK